MASAAESLAIGLAGGVASVFARTVVYPADVLRTVYVTRGREGVRPFPPFLPSLPPSPFRPAAPDPRPPRCHVQVAELGLGDLYRALHLAAVDAFTYHAANFGVYELLRGIYFRFWRGGAGAIGAPLPPLAGLFLGMISGVTGQTVPLPLPRPPLPHSPRRPTGGGWWCRCATRSRR